MKDMVVKIINKMKTQSEQKMKQILKANWIKTDKEKVVCSINNNVYHITFKKTGMKVTNQNSAGAFSFNHIDKEKEKILFNLWQQTQSFGYTAAKIHGTSESEFKQLIMDNTSENKQEQLF